MIYPPDGSELASRSDDQTVKLWDVKTGKEKRTLSGHMGPVWAVRFAPNGRHLVAAGDAGRLQYWDLTTFETFLYRYSFGPGAWLALLPDGRFDASPEGMRYLGYIEVGGFAYYPAETMIKEFYSPEAVSAVMAKYL